ncbi:MAG: hypothetical protein COB41_00050 [Proteobacteria bacterium]|nr:MAG: hypothetical protein COB41_00050 [Pseudomonadota bacterium]
MKDFVETYIECPGCGDKDYVELEISVGSVGVGIIELVSKPQVKECGECGCMVHIRISQIIDLEVEDKK